jgi:hypothetical protein
MSSLEDMITKTTKSIELINSKAPTGSSSEKDLRGIIE